VTLKSGLEITQDHSNWYHSKAWVRIPFPSEWCHDVSCGKTRMAWLPDCKKIADIFIHFDRMYERDRETNRQTDTAWRHRPRLSIASRDNKWQHCSARTFRDMIPNMVESFIINRAPSNVAKSDLFFFFWACSQYFRDRRADLHQIFQEDGNWAAIEKLRLVYELFRGAG